MSPESRFEQTDETQPLRGGAGEEDPRLFQAVQQYLSEIESGRRTTRQEFASRYPDIRDELSACLQGLAFVNAAGAQMGVAGARQAADTGLMSEPLGDFRLLREIGRGGMGIVYEAMQLSLGRRVAVKVLPLASALDPRHIQRFRNEAQAAAQLHHTNIVPVYAVGCERSVHFYAMQLIEGQSLAVVIADLRRSLGRSSAPADRSSPSALTRSANESNASKCAGPFSTGKPRPSSDAAAGATVSRSALHSLPELPPNKRGEFYDAVARLGLQAAEALEYAHRQGVVHRDIKPANLLLDERGTLWISDFGLAQIYAENGLTQTGDILGTFRYMSPEQASGGAAVLDQRTDVYSLGVTLYELLTLERAQPGENRDELLHQIHELDPRPPRSIDRGIPIELETILAKAVAKDPRERYSTADALALDLRRFLNNEPISARRASLLDKAFKWTRRHRTLARSAVAMLVLACMGLTLTTLLVSREQRRTQAAYQREQQQRLRAERSYEEAHRAVDFFTRVAADQVPKEISLVQLRKTMLETSLEYYGNFIAERTGDPRAEAQLIAAREKVAHLLTEVSTVDDLLRLDYSFRLLRTSPVQEELRMTPDQVNSISQTTFKPPPPRPAPGSDAANALAAASTSTHHSWLADEANTRREMLKEILSPEQTERLRQISRQLRGIFAFTDPDISTVMQLSSAQKQNIRAAQTEFWSYARHQPPSDSSTEIVRIQMQAAVDRILAQLNPSQVGSWKTLTGANFTAPAPSFVSNEPPSTH